MFAVFAASPAPIKEVAFGRFGNVGWIGIQYGRHVHYMFVYNELELASIRQMQHVGFV